MSVWAIRTAFVARFSTATSAPARTPPDSSEMVPDIPPEFVCAIALTTTKMLINGNTGKVRRGLTVSPGPEVRIRFAGSRLIAESGDSAIIEGDLLPENRCVCPARDDRIGCRNVARLGIEMGLNKESFRGGRFDSSVIAADGEYGILTQCATATSCRSSHASPSV